MNRMIGGSLGVAVIGAVFQAKIGAFDPSALVGASAAVRGEFVNALAGAMTLSAIIAALGAVVAVSMLRGTAGVVSPGPGTPVDEFTEAEELVAV